MDASNRHEDFLKILDQALEADSASFGLIQLRKTSGDGLEIVASRGFGREFLELFRDVPPDCPSTCGRALRLGRRVLIRDVTQDPFFTPFVPVANRAGFRAVQSTPILGSDGRLLGILSTHFKAPHVLSHSATVQLDRCATMAAQLIMQKEKGEAIDPATTRSPRL